MPEKPQRPAQEPSQLPFLTVDGKNRRRSLRMHFQGPDRHELATAPLDEETAHHFFARDAFSNPAHVQFALRGTLAVLGHLCHLHGD